MNDSLSRRKFLAAGIGLPASAFASNVFGSNTTKNEGLTSNSVPANGFEYRILGRTGLKVTTVGFGCMITSDPSVITKAAELGINYFDTAREYQHGNNERMVGSALGAKRKQIILSSKTEATNKQEAMQQLETSLKELGTDYLDIWFLHSKDNPAEVTDELLEATQIAKKQGKVRFPGLSTHRPDVMMPVIIKAGVLDVALFTYNYTMGDRFESTIESARQAGLGIVAMKVMARGKTGLKPGVAPAALKWAIQSTKVHTSIPSMVDMDQLEQNMNVMGAPLTDTDQKILGASAKEMASVYCRMCGNCHGQCPQGLPVANLLRYLTYAEGYGQFALGREKFLTLPEKLREVRCNDCASCSIQCPNGLQVSMRLARAQQIFG
jgi:aryl-alcohol dehydrogenase-like predicted oxidoreductase